MEHYDIFISYKRNDKEKVFAIKNYIEKNVGVNCWIDLDGIESDAQFANVIIKAINDAHVFLFMYSASHAEIEDLDNDWTVREISFAQRRKKRIVFINIDGTPLTDWFDLMFGTKQQVDVTSNNAIKKLCTDLRKWFKIEEPDNKPNRAVSKSVPKPSVKGETFAVDLGALKFNMIRVEGGKIEIGATSEQTDEAESNEYPAHIVSINSFYIGQFPVTQNVWELVMGYNKSHFIDNGIESIESHDEDVLTLDNEPASYGANNATDATALAVGTLLAGPLLLPVLGAVVGAINKDNTKPVKLDDYGHLPAENISHDEAVEFVRRLSRMTGIRFALPTEEEWEYAARGGQKSQGYKYAGSNDPNAVAWFKENAKGTTHPVGGKMPNELGIYDMSGNVWEWTETPAHSFTLNLIRKYMSDENSIFIRRGGSWWHEAKNCRVSRRYASDHSKKTSGLGLRVVIRENVE